MSTDEQWAERVKGLLKAELKRKNLSYKELADLLCKMDIPSTERGIINKVSRGSFSAVFFIQCLSAIGCHTVRLEDEA